MPGGRVPSPSWRAPARTNPVTSRSGQAVKAMPMLAEGVELAGRGRPHTHTPAAAVVAATTGAVLAQATAAATPAGYRQLLALAAQQLAQPRAGGHHAAFQARLTTRGQPARPGLPHPTPRPRDRRPPPGHHRPGPGLAARAAHPPWGGPDRGRHRAVCLVHPGRCPSDAALAMLGGAAPIPASSGQTVPVRLNRSGDHQLNQALHLLVLTRLRYDPATRADATRRRTQRQDQPRDPTLPGPLRRPPARPTPRSPTPPLTHIGASARMTVAASIGACMDAGRS